MKPLKITNNLLIILDNVKIISKGDESNYIFYIAFDDKKVTYNSKDFRDKEFDEIVKYLGAKEL